MAVAANKALVITKLSPRKRSFIFEHARLSGTLEDPYCIKRTERTFSPSLVVDCVGDLTGESSQPVNCNSVQILIKESHSSSFDTLCLPWRDEDKPLQYSLPCIKRAFDSDNSWL